MPATAIDEAELRERHDRWLRAIRARDVEAALSFYADDVVVYDLVAPLRRAGVAAVRERTREWFGSFDGPIGYEVRELRVEAAGDLGFIRSLNGVRARRTDGQDVQMWIRVTLCCSRAGGQWKVVHEHVSVPFDMQSLRAELSLEPQQA